MQLHACKVRGLLSYLILQYTHKQENISLEYYSGIRAGFFASLSENLLRVSISLWELNFIDRGREF